MIADNDNEEITKPFSVLQRTQTMQVYLKIGERKSRNAGRCVLVWGMGVIGLLNLLLPT
jgi:threonine dehydrogenase-like Zn-dependent dehydrogenase